MHRSTFIALLIPLIMLAVAMTFRYFDNDSMGQMPSAGVGSLYANGITQEEVTIIVYEQITKLKELGIDATSVEDKIAESFASFPAEILESMDIRHDSHEHRLAAL